MRLNFDDLRALPYAPTQRWGQQIWNRAEALWPWLIEDLRGSDLDPYYDNKRTNAFTAEVHKRVDAYNAAMSQETR